MSGPPRGQQLPLADQVKKNGLFWRNGVVGCAGIIGLIILIAYVLIILIPFGAGLAGHSASSSSSPRAGLITVRQAVTESGHGSKVITPFNLSQGNYKVTWTAAGHAAFIVNVTLGDQTQHLVNEVPPNPSSGQALFNAPLDADYVLTVDASTLSWSITFRPV